MSDQETEQVVQVEEQQEIIVDTTSQVNEEITQNSKNNYSENDENNENNQNDITNQNNLTDENNKTNENNENENDKNNETNESNQNDENTDVMNETNENNENNENNKTINNNELVPQENNISDENNKSNNSNEYKNNNNNYDNTTNENIQTSNDNNLTTNNVKTIEPNKEDEITIDDEEPPTLPNQTNLKITVTMSTENTGLVPDTPDNTYGNINEENEVVAPLNVKLNPKSAGTHEIRDSLSGISLPDVDTDVDIDAPRFSIKGIETKRKSTIPDKKPRGESVYQREQNKQLKQHIENNIIQEEENNDINNNENYNNTINENNNNNENNTTQDNTTQDNTNNKNNNENKQRKAMKFSIDSDEDDSDEDSEYDPNGIEQRATETQVRDARSKTTGNLYLFEGYLVKNGKKMYYRLSPSKELHCFNDSDKNSDVVVCIDLTKKLTLKQQTTIEFHILTDTQELRFFTNTTKDCSDWLTAVSNLCQIPSTFQHPLPDPTNGTGTMGNDSNENITAPNSCCIIL